MDKLMVVLLIILVIIFVISLSVWDKIKSKKEIEQEWKRIPKITRKDREKSLYKAWKMVKEKENIQNYVDDITWNDLDMQRVFELLNGTKSSIGAEYLYRALHTTEPCFETFKQQNKLIESFEKEDKLRAKAQFILKGIGKRDNNFAIKYLYDPAENELQHAYLFYLLGILPLLLFILALIFKQPSLVIVLIFACSFNIFYYYRKKSKIETELLSMNYLVAMIGSTKALSKLPTIFQEELQTIQEKIKGVQAFAFSFRYKEGSEIEFIFEYLNILFMGQLISYNFVLRKLAVYNKEIKRLYEIIGLMDMSLAVLNFQAIMPYYCEAAFNEEKDIQAKESYHPLLAEAVTNPVNWQEHTLVTGSNASGKSTYVKSVAINCILAQTLGIACAENWIMTKGQVFSSMAIEDDLLEGDSYFVAEIKSVKRILKNIQKKAFTYCFIDEILRGTNTVERIASSSSIIQWLKDYPCLSFVATHDIELTEILKEECSNIHFKEKVTEGKGVTFDYILREGPAKSRNAIELLSVMAYPATVVSQAKKMASYFEANKKWPID